MLYLALLCPCFTAIAGANEMTEEELIEAVGADAEVRSLISLAVDPVGQEGLWGMEMTMIIAHPADKVYAILADIEKYPERLKKVKRAKVLKRTPDGLIVDYAEGAMGIEISSTLENKLDPKKRTIISRSIGKEDAISWSRMDIEEVGHPGFCRLRMIAYADTSFVPNWIMNMVSSVAGKGTANEIRKMIDAAERDAD